ncbi:MAG: DUF4432 family protein [Chloroflexota bacterium]
MPRPDLRIGDLGQLASARQIRLGDGVEDGVRCIDVRVAGGIHALVLADRGLDIGPAWVAGEPLTWQSPTGIVHPSYYRDDVFLRSLHGGLMFTAGLQNVGSPNVDEGVAYGHHGRISNLPATNITAEVEEDEAGLAVVVRGSVREEPPFGVDLLLRRTLRFRVGTPELDLRDEVRNLGHTAAPLFILYHCNIGYPVVEAASRMIAPPADVIGWDEVSRDAEAEHAAFVPPDPDFPVQVFEHRIRPTAPDRVAVSIVNPDYPPAGSIGIEVSWSRRQLPRLWQWRNLAAGLYVTGIEPANCLLQGRAAARAAGEIPMIDPGETKEFGVRFRAGVGPAALALLP